MVTHALISGSPVSLRYAHRPPIQKSVRPPAGVAWRGPAHSVLGDMSIFVMGQSIGKVVLLLDVRVYKFSAYFVIRLAARSSLD